MTTHYLFKQSVNEFTDRGNMVLYIENFDKSFFSYFIISLYNSIVDTRMEAIQQLV